MSFFPPFFLFFFFASRSVIGVTALTVVCLKSSRITPLCNSLLPSPSLPSLHIVRLTRPICPMIPRCRAYRDDDIFGLISSCFNNARARLLTSHITHTGNTPRGVLRPPISYTHFLCMMISEHKRPCAGETIVDVVARKTTVYHRNHCIDSKHYDKLNKRIEKYNTSLSYLSPRPPVVAKYSL